MRSNTRRRQIASPRRQKGPPAADLTVSQHLVIIIWHRHVTPARAPHSVTPSRVDRLPWNDTFGSTTFRTCSVPSNHEHEYLPGSSVDIFVHSQGWGRVWGSPPSWNIHFCQFVRHVRVRYLVSLVSPYSNQEPLVVALERPAARRVECGKLSAI